jgi:hypothetical protein
MRGPAIIKMQLCEGFCNVQTFRSLVSCYGYAHSPVSCDVLLSGPFHVLS